MPQALQLPSPSALRIANMDLEREVAERKRAESGIRELNERLEARVAERTRELEDANRILRQAQLTVLQHERLRALGEMASGITHDINNALTPAALNSKLLLDLETNLSDEARECLVDIHRSVEDVAHTVARLREFYRQREPQFLPAPIQINRILEQVVDLLRARWLDMPQERGIVVDLEMSLAADLPRVLGVESEVHDALVNLILNAVDAMPAGGRLTLRSRRGGCPARTHGFRAGPATARPRRGLRHGRGNERGDPAQMFRAVLHHQGRARHRSRSRDGVRHGAAAPGGD
jgi:C4-dicarboxylate-specific signal transduction histidine kinase